MENEKFAMPRALLCGHDSSRMPELKDESVTLVITSPPYFPLGDEAVFYRRALAKRLDLEEAGRRVLGFADTLCSRVFSECFRVLKPGGHLVIQTKDIRYGTDLIPLENEHRQCAARCGFAMTARHFYRPLHTSFSHMQAMRRVFDEAGIQPLAPEVFLVMRKSGKPIFGTPSEESEKLLTANFMSTPTGNLTVRHQYQSPMPVVMAFVETYSNRGDTVLDPFAGGGAVGLAAVTRRRNAVLYETEPQALRMIETNLAGYLADE